MNVNFTHDVYGDNKDEEKFWIFPKRVFIKLLVGGSIGYVFAQLGGWRRSGLILCVITWLITLVFVILNMIEVSPKGVFKGAGLTKDEQILRRLMFKKRTKVYVLGLDAKEE